MEVDYSRQAGLEPIDPHQGQFSEPVSKTEQPYDEQAYAAKPTRQVCGLRPVTLGLIAALVLLAIAAAVGGGVGGTIAVKNAKDSARQEALAAAAASASAAAAAASSTTTKPSPTTTANIYSETTLAWGPVFTDPLPSSGCPKTNNTIYSSINGPQNWRIYCGFDMPGNDFIQTNTPNLQLCIETCANWNTVFGEGNKCLGVAFVPKFILGAEVTSPPSDCYLKSNASVNLLLDKSDKNFEYDSVILQNSN